MGRRKGSKNKKTLMKEAEALAKAQQGENNSSKGENNPSKGESKENPNPSMEHMDGNRAEYNSDNSRNSITILHSNPSRSDNNNCDFDDVLPNAINSSDAVNSEEKIEEKVEEKIIDTTEEKVDTKKKKEKDYLKCERCASPIHCEARKIDTNMITGMADYHRTSVRYVRLCDKCCRELSGIVDKWLSDPESGGNPVLSKWYGK